MTIHVPRLVVAGLSGDAGKTLVALGLARTLVDRGVRVAPFKKGPDYIDAAWLGLAAGAPGRNLDTFMMPPEALSAALARAAGAGIVLVEGNRGLHDGADATGTHSTAELAKRLGAPVVLVADATKTTRTLAACVKGCAVIDPDLRLAGVILNRVATARQARVITDAFASMDGPPVVGAIPRLDGDPLPSRHLGLVTAVEHGDSLAAIARAASVVAAHVDVETLVAIARSAAPIDATVPQPLVAAPGPRVRIGVLRDEAFSFYYPDNLDALTEAGADLVEVSPLRAPAVPEVDAIYAGGGFPEIHAAALAANGSFLRSVRQLAAAGLPIFAECGGVMFLARELRVGARAHAMAGALDIAIEQTSRPQGHGYVEGVVDRANPFLPEGTPLRGHEFHYSHIVESREPETAVSLTRGTGVGARRDALVSRSIWASYLHVHALATPEWARGLVAAAAEWRRAGRVVWA